MSVNDRSCNAIYYNILNTKWLILKICALRMLVFNKKCAETDLISIQFAFLLLKLLYWLPFTPFAGPTHFRVVRPHRAYVRVLQPNRTYRRSGPTWPQSLLVFRTQSRALCITSHTYLDQMHKCIYRLDVLCMICTRRSRSSSILFIIDS